MPEITAAEVGRLEAEAAARGCQIDLTPDGYVTEVCVPSFGDGGIQRLHSNMPEPEPEAEL